MKEKYLEIKHYIDLKELEKFGFVQRDDGAWELGGVFDGTPFSFIVVYENRKIHVFDGGGLVTLFDLIQSGFVKKGGKK